MNRTALFHALRCVVLGSLTLSSVAHAAPRAIVPTVVVDTKKATAESVITLWNDSAEDVEDVQVTVGDFVSLTTNQALGTRRELTLAGAAAPRGDVPRAAEWLSGLTVAKGSVVRVRLAVSELRDAGVSVAAVDVSGATTALRVATELRALSLDVPFNVALQQEGDDRPAIVFEDGRPRQLLVKNDDPQAYLVAWKLFLPDAQEMLDGTVLLPPKSAVPVALPKPPAGWVRHPFDGLFKDDVRTAYAVLAFAPEGVSASAGAIPMPAPAPDVATHREGVITPASFVAPPPRPPLRGLPTRTAATQVRIARYTDGEKALWSNLLVFLALLMGGFASLFLGLASPNKQKRLELRGRIADVLEDIRRLSPERNSELRVALRVERLRLRDAVDHTPLFSAESSDRHSRLAEEITRLDRRVDAALKLDECARRIEELRGAPDGAPPTRIKEAGDALREASRLLEHAAVDADIQKAEADARQVGARLDAIAAEDPQFARSLADGFKKVSALFAASAAGSTFRRLCDAVPPLSRALGDPGFGEEARITRDRYQEVDVAVQRANLLAQYASARDAAGSGKKLEEMESRLLPLLEDGSPTAQADAGRLVLECKQGKFVTDLVEELGHGDADRRVTVTCSPPVVTENEPARLEVRFANETLDRSAARSELRCRWRFPGNVGSEEGWSIAHYFRSRKEARGTVEISSLDSASPLKTIPFEFDVQAPAKTPWVTERGWLEGGRLAIALVLAVLALVAGARDQLLKGDVGFGLVAIFLMGVGADSIKTLFTTKRG